MAFYDDMKFLASEVLAEFKQGKVEYVQLVPGTGPIDNPGPSTPVKKELDAAARGVKFKYVQSGLALATDMQVTAAIHPEVTPDARDSIDIDGIRYKIVEFLPKPAAGVAVAWVFILRKG